MGVDARQLNALTLAYIGDAIYEVFIREYLIEKGTVKPDKLHHLAVNFVAADKQAYILHAWMNEKFLTEEEMGVVKRGRNAKSRSTPKNMSISDYRHATAFETLLGYLHLIGRKERLETLMSNAIERINLYENELKEKKG